MPALMDQHVIPRLVSGGTRARDCVIPLVGALESGVNVIHDAPVVKPVVVHDLPHKETGGTLRELGHENMRRFDYTPDKICRAYTTTMRGEAK